MSSEGKRFSRRELLKLAGLGTATAWLASCSATGSAAPSQAEVAQEKIELKISTDWNVGPRKEFMDQIVAEFHEANPDVEAEVWHMGGGGSSGPGTMLDIVVAQLLTDTAADVIMGWGLMLFERREYLADITEKMDELGINVKDDYYYATEACYSSDGRLYGVPWGHSVSGWIYNRTMFQEAGVDEPTEEWDWWDMVDAAKQLTNLDEQQYGVLAHQHHSSSAHEHMFAAGGTYRTQDGTKTNMGTEGAAAAFQRYIDLIYKEQVAPNPADATAIAGTTNAFAEGRIAMRPQLIHNVGGMARDVADRFEWAVMPTPKDPDTGMAANAELTEPWFVGQATLDRGTFDKACEMAALMVSDTGQELLISTGAFMPGKKGWLEDPRFLEPLPYNKEQIKKNLDTTLKIPQMYFTQWSEWFTAYYTQNLTAAWTGEIPVAQVLQQACDAGDAVLAKYTPEPWPYDYGFYPEVGY